MWYMLACGLPCINFVWKSDWYRPCCLKHFPKSKKSWTRPVWGWCWPNNGPIFLLRFWIGSLAFWTGFSLKGYWSCTSAFSSKIISHIMYMIKTYIIKIQSWNLIQDNRLLAVQKMSFQMIRKTKILNRIIQSKMILVQVKKIWTWTGIGIVCRNIGPIAPVSFFGLTMICLLLKKKRKKGTCKN